MNEGGCASYGAGICGAQGAADRGHCAAGWGTATSSPLYLSAMAKGHTQCSQWAALLKKFPVTLHGCRAEQRTNN